MGIETEQGKVQVDPVEVMERSAFFGVLASESRRELASHLRRVKFPAGAVVVRQGDEGHCCYLIAEGTVEVWAAKTPAALAKIPAGAGAVWSPDPHHHTLLATLGPGGAFGEMELLLGGLRRATVRAAASVVLYSLDEATFAGVVHRHRGLAVALEEEMVLRGVGAALGTLSPFASLPPDALRWLASCIQTMWFDPGADVVRQGEPGDALYVIRSGHASVLVAEPDGTQREIATLGPGDPFGEQELLTGDPGSATVRALERLELLRLGREDFASVLSQYRDRETYFVQLVLRRQRPRRIEHWVLERQEGTQAPVYVLKDTRNQRYVKLSEQGAFLWELMDGRRTVPDLTLAYFTRYKVFGVDTVLEAMIQLHRAGFLSIQEIGSHRLEQERPANLLRRIGQILRRGLFHSFSLPDVDGAVTWLYRHLLRPFYFRPVLILLLLVTLAGAALFYGYLAGGGVHPPLGSSIGNLALAGAFGLFLHALLHETAHAVTCKHFGREVHRAGVGLYLFMPMAFVDTSDIWMEGRLARASVAFAGPYTNLALSSMATLLIPVVGDPWFRVVLFQFAFLGYVLGLANMNPLLEYDGYYVLMDWLDVPNLRANALASLGAVLWRVPRPARDQRLARVFLFYGVLTLLYTLFVAWSVFTGYQAYLQEVVRQILPAPAALALGWILAGLMAYLILQRAWSDLRAGVEGVGDSFLRGIS